MGSHSADFVGAEAWSVASSTADEPFWDTFWDERPALDEQSAPAPARSPQRRTARRVARGAALTVALTAGLTATANAATVLTVAGNGLLVRTPMANELNGALCQGENTCQTVQYPNAGLGAVPLQQGLVNLAKSVDTTSGPKIVMAYSQGGMIATMWLTQHAGDQSDNQTMFILFGNPDQGKNGIGPSFNHTGATPTDTVYRVVDICREYDSECDWPNDPTNLLAVLNAAAGYLTVHLDYSGVDVTSPTNLVQTDGNTTYVLVPTDHLPLLEPLRRFGFTALADRLDAQLKPIIDAAYNRSGYTPLGAGTIPGFPTSQTVSAPQVTALSSRMAVSAVPVASTSAVTVPAAAATSGPATAPDEPSSAQVTDNAAGTGDTEPTTGGGIAPTTTGTDGSTGSTPSGGAEASSTQAGPTESDTAGPDTAGPDTAGPDTAGPGGAGAGTAASSASGTAASSTAGSS